MEKPYESALDNDGTCHDGYGDQCRATNYFFKDSKIKVYIGDEEKCGTLIPKTDKKGNKPTGLGLVRAEDCDDNPVAKDSNYQQQKWYRNETTGQVYCNVKNKETGEEET